MVGEWVSGWRLAFHAMSSGGSEGRGGLRSGGGGGGTVVVGWSWWGFE